MKEGQRDRPYRKALARSLLPNGVAILSGQAFDLALDIIELPDAVKCFPGDLGFGRGPNIMEVAPEMRPTGGLAELGTAIGAALIEGFEPGIGISLQDTAAVCQMLAWVLTLSIR